MASILLIGVALAKGDVARGKTPYDQKCAPGHGTSGRGDGPAAAALNPKPNDLVEKGCIKPLKEGYLKKLIKGGGGGRWASHA